MLWQRGKGYTQDLRARVLAAADEGARAGQIALRPRVSVSYVSKVLSRRRQTSEVSARPQRCHLKRKLSGLHQAIQDEVAARPDATLAELRRWLSQTHGTAASDGLMHSTLARLGLTLKKSRCTRPSRSAPASPPRVPSGASASPG